MLITYIRSSSFNNWDFCQMQYYMNYVLGLPREASKKADKGTTVHKVMEILANCKKIMQPRRLMYDMMIDDVVPELVCDCFIGDRLYIFKDEHIGNVTWSDSEFLKPYALTNEEVDAINKTRINKYTYMHDAQIPYGTIHYGKEFVDGIFERVYNYYSSEDWAPVDKKDCYNWTWMVTEYKNGIFDPRKRNIVEAEPHFNFEIDKSWAYYEWTLPTGEKISGNLGIKGTIDLITAHPGGIIEIVDWKTGQRKDWGAKIKSEEVKTYKKLCTDFQLMLYYYAAKQLFPHAKQIIVSIYFIRHGGPFTICMDDNVIKEVEDRLCDRFQEIAACQLPAMQDVTQRDFRCTRICDYYKMVAPNGDNMCKFIHEQIQKKGIDEVTNKYTQEGFSVGAYQAPGEAS
jgi:hypothetical protein